MSSAASQDLSDNIDDDINKCDFFVFWGFFFLPLFNEMCQCLEDMYNLVGQLFSNEPCTILQNHAVGKRST